MRAIREVEAGSIIRWFVANLSTALKKVRKLGPLLRFREAIFKTIDLRFLPIGEKEGMRDDRLADNSVDLIVTSPPYPNTTDYHLYHRFRLFWLGYNPRDLGHAEIGSHLRHQKEGTGFDGYLKEMTFCLQKMKQVLRPGRYSVIVVGDGVFKGKTYNTAEHLGNAAREIGFDVIGTLNRAVHATKRSFISAARRMRTENILVLRKPMCEIKLQLIKPPCGAWNIRNSLIPWGLKHFATKPKALWVRKSETNKTL